MGCCYSKYLKMWVQLCNWTVGRDWRSMRYILGIQMLKEILVRYQADVRNKSWTAEDGTAMDRMFLSPQNLYIEVPNVMVPGGAAL